MPTATGRGVCNKEGVVAAKRGAVASEEAADGAEVAGDVEAGVVQVATIVSAKCVV